MEIATFDIISLGPFWAIILLLLVAGTASFFLTELVRRFGQAYKEKKQQTLGKKLWWWRSLLRLLAVCVGSAAGYLLAPTVLGAGLGFVGGVLNAAIVAAFKERLSGLFAKLGPNQHASVTDDGQGEDDDSWQPPSGTTRP